MKTKPSGWIVRWACPLRLLLLLFVSSLAPIGIRAAVVYDNTALAGMTKDGVFLLTEYGDEIALVGTDRWVTQFDIATFGDFPTNAVVTAVARIYANDGTDALDGPHYAYRPKSVLWESAPFTLKPGGQTSSFSPLIKVPDTFTWTVRFTGVQQVTGNSVGPIVLNPILIGAPLANGHMGSYPDYWRKDGTTDDSWRIYLLSSGTPANFYVKVTATPEPATLPNLKMVRSGNSLVLEVFGIAGAEVLGESSDDLKTWSEAFRVTGKGPGSPERVTINLNRVAARQFWRVGTPRPATLPNLKMVRSGNSLVLEVFGTTGKAVILESSGDLRSWAEAFRVTGKGPGNPERVSIVSNTGVPVVFWRAREN